MDSNMNRIIKSFVPLLLPVCVMLLGMMVSCTSDDDSGGEVTAGISLHIKPVTRAADSSVNTGSEAENKINNVHVWFFAANAGDGDQALYCYTTQSPISSTNGEMVLNISDEELMLHHNMNSQGAYQLFVVANLPADATMATDISLGDLKTYSYGASARPGSPFCMTGSTDGAHDFAIDSRITISLLRVASRLDVKIVNITGKTLQVNKVSIADDQKSVQLFAPASGSVTPASSTFTDVTDIFTTSTIAGEVTCSGYVYENRSATPVKVVVEGSIDGTSVVWKADIKPDGLATLMRNTICEVTLKLKDKIDPTDVECKILGWDDTNIDAPVYGAYLTIMEKTVPVSPDNGGMLHVHTNATSIKVNWENTNHIYLDGYRETNNANVPVVNGVAALKFNLISSENINFNEDITIEASGLQSKITLYRQDVGYLFDVKKISIVTSGYSLTHGMKVPADLWTSQTGISYFTVKVNRNVPWFYKVAYYKVADGSTAMPAASKAFTYDGTPGEIDQKIDMRANVLSEDVRVVLELGVGLISSGFTVYTIEFTLLAKV